MGHMSTEAAHTHGLCAYFTFSLSDGKFLSWPLWQVSLYFEELHKSSILFTFTDVPYIPHYNLTSYTIFKIPVWMNWPSGKSGHKLLQWSSRWIT